MIGYKSNGELHIFIHVGDKHSSDLQFIVGKDFFVPNIATGVMTDYDLTTFACVCSKQAPIIAESRVQGGGEPLFVLTSFLCVPVWMRDHMEGIPHDY